MSDILRDEKGRYVKGRSASPSTQFKPGQHWREHQLFREKEWLEQEYVQNFRSAADIATQFGVTEAAIFFWLHKHDIPRRKVAEVRSKKHWGLSGSANPMYGKCGEQSVNWKGGVTPLRQLVYSSLERKLAVKIVWERDGSVCSECGAFQANRRRMHLHHIKSFATCVEGRCDPDNIVLLCSKCHGKRHRKQQGL
jgi:HNH endonuclease